jgi:hypothetical protein
VKVKRGFVWYTGESEATARQARHNKQGVGNNLEVLCLTVAIQMPSSVLKWFEILLPSLNSCQKITL